MGWPGQLALRSLCRVLRARQQQAHGSPACHSPASAQHSFSPVTASAQLQSVWHDRCSSLDAQRLLCLPSQRLQGRAFTETVMAMELVAATGQARL
jgi:hypothetical protein